MPDGLSDRSPLPTLSEAEPKARPGGVVIGTLIALHEDGIELRYPDMPEGVDEVSLGVSTLEFGPDDVGEAVVVGFVDGDRRQPIVLGRLIPVIPAPGAGPVVIADGQRLRVEAQEELVLCCGKASITLRANGRLVLRGTYVETRATGVNRVRGGSVAIN